MVEQFHCLTNLSFFGIPLYLYIYVDKFILTLLIYIFLMYIFSGLSMNISCVDDKSPVQIGFFKNSTGDLLLALGVLSTLYNFCNFLIIFSLM